MTTTIKTRGKTRFLAIILLVIFAFAGMFSMTASAAMSSFWQGGDIFTTNTFTGGVFNSGDCNKITLSVVTTEKYGSPCNVKLQLQKNGLFGWSTVRTDTIWSTSDISGLYRDFQISKNTDYRILCSLNSSDALSVVNISMGIVIFN